MVFIFVNKPYFFHQTLVERVTEEKPTLLPY